MSERPSRRWAACPAARAALCAAGLVGLALNVLAADIPGAATQPALREKDVRRAEKVLAKLATLDRAATSGEDPKAYHALAAELYPGLFVTVADMRESDLKTDLDTAAFLYARVGRAWLAAGASKADCENERRDVYLPLCLDLRGGTARQLLLSKARLHARWAEAVVKNYRGAGDAETVRALAAMKAARENDRVIVARIVEKLQPLQRLINNYPTYADYQEGRAASEVGPDRTDAEVADALSTASLLLASMPRSPAFYHLSGARDSYRDGLFWYRKVQRSRSMVVSAEAFEGDPLRDLRLNADQVGYAVVVNWRAAAKYTRIAEHSLSLAGR
ncbi:MAG TPA: hypothetical protein VF538_00950 [Pyrinomonadaceae bacterium]|jgi:hypothetical protein